eukprot:CAMPEP_0202392370 /NCGR_PEP_ID=MMETSP1127-20130417/92335_1 /ASSEMBLY_ACC=CAM_ASM_000462 /TAXON_ID=3047 /ORGANISM="Dunaliella tertiolecta, Strain CCMP1320" /LENGTH=45 /DNA_ID= /DNA_START= /DNA_END= /DNA_ORIENTATION=
MLRNGWNALQRDPLLLLRSRVGAPSSGGLMVDMERPSLLMGDLKW